MIRIRKRAVGPGILTVQGSADRLRLEAIYTADPAGCQVPRSQHLKADPAIYGHPDVKQALILDQHAKCCYCESRFDATGFGDVEHFRPKAGARQTKSGPLEKPGYYWLAYEWQNLLYSCEVCNRRHKGNWFPLFNPSRRARHHGQGIGREHTVLPDPTITNPGRYLDFNQHVVTATKRQGKASIMAYGLDRPALNRRREEVLSNLKFNQLAAALDIDAMTAAKRRLTLSMLNMTPAEVRRYAANAQAVLDKAALDSAEYAGMIRANFPHLPRR